MIGLISQRVSIKEVAKNAIADAKYMCSRIHGDAPEVRGGHDVCKMCARVWRGSHSCTCPCLSPFP